ncbi:MAG: MerR family transcriptional regulator [Clostridia bacterium]|nr:MerR family transcriptional regulator [Lachnospiraceae bacterium]NCC01651.1 MerR family transcriptional regulator [Clostridia bacterium]
MEYSIRKLSEMAGVSARTLRYYDEIDLLKPLYTDDSGQRYYGENEVALLQQILFYRERGFDLKRIQRILYQEDFDIMQALEEHLLELEGKRKYMDSLVRTVKQTISSMKGECEMSDKEKFQAFKERLVKENEEHYGEEIRKKYGEESVSESNKKVLNMSEEDFEKFKCLENEIKDRLRRGVQFGMAPDSEEAGEIVKLHKEWLCMTWKNFTPEAHMGVSSMYVVDDRFKAYYDSEVSGCAELLYQSVLFWAGK